VHLFETNAVAALAAIRKGDVSAQELASLFLQRIETLNPGLGALRHVSADAAIEAARETDRGIRSGGKLGLLAGLPVVVKENCDTYSLPCSAGLSFRKNNVPKFDSAIVRRLREAGAIILGMAVSDPGAFGVRTVHVTHPHDTHLTVGGSSGGSAAALAASLCLGAVGTDTGGSIRIPSACCGTVGLKPTYGALPIEGVFPLVPSLDHVGPMARSVADVQLLWHAMAGTAPEEPGSLTRVGYDPRWVEIADSAIRIAFSQGLDRLKDRGIAAIEIELPQLDDVVATHGEIFIVEAAAWHCGHHAEMVDTYPGIARAWFEIARDMKVDAYVEAFTRRVAMTRVVDRLMNDVDAIITPTICVARPPKFAETLTIAGQTHDYIMALVRLTCLFDHTGHPAIAFPLLDGDETLTSSLQIVGPRGGEARILQIADLMRAA